MGQKWPCDGCNETKKIIKSGRLTTGNDFQFCDDCYSNRKKLSNHFSEKEILEYTKCYIA